MPRILVGGKILPVGLEILRAYPNAVVDYIEEVSTIALEPLVYRADALLLRTQPLPAAMIAKCPSLKIVSRHGAGYDSVDLDALNQRGIALAITGDVNSRSVAEHAMMLMLAVGKRLPKYIEASRGENWNYRNSMEAGELFAKTLLIIGFGRIGQSLAHLALAFGMKVVTHDPFVDPPRIDLEKVTLESDLKRALGSADYVSVHVPKSGAPVLGVAELSAMKPSAILINTARGGVVDEAALVKALEAGTIAAAGIDVFEEEPPMPGHPLSRMEQVVLTPHSAGLSHECAERMAMVSARNITDFLDGKLNPAMVVNAYARGAEHAG